MAQLKQEKHNYTILNSQTIVILNFKIDIDVYISFIVTAYNNVTLKL